MTENSANNKSNDLRKQAVSARAARKSGKKVVRGKSETAYKKQAKAWDAGSVGEKRVERKLDLLGRYGFTLFHDVLLEPGKNWNLDHMVVGPPGIFFVDAKNWRGNITVSDKEELWKHYNAGPKTGRKSENMTSEVKKVRGMASHASSRLGTKIVPVIALAGARSRHFEGISRVSGVYVLSMDTILPWLRDAKPVFDAEKIKTLSTRTNLLFPPADPQSKPQKPDWTKDLGKPGDF